MENAIGNDINKLGNPQENMQMMNKASSQVIKEGIKKAHPHLSDNQAEKASEQLMSNNNNGKVKVGDTEVSIADFAYAVALSIQTINSETSPQEEFYRWIDDAKSVISEMTDSNITEADLKHREEFLADMDQREVEIKTCLSLYETAAFSGSARVREQAQKQLDFLRMKYAKLLELRSAVKNSTKSRIQVILEPKVQEDEYIRGKLYIMALHYMRRGLDVPMRIKLRLGMIGGVRFDQSIVGILLDEEERPKRTKEDIISRINILRGRQDPSYSTKSNTKGMHFSSERFNRLVAKYNSNTNF